MNVTILSTLSHHKAPAEAFAQGLKKHGINATIHVGRPERAPVCDLLVSWGLRNAMRATGRYDNFLVMERAYFEPRFEWISFGYNGLNGRADFLNKNSPSDRFEKYFSDQLKPWNTNGDYVLLTTQVRGDKSISGLNIDYNKIIKRIRANTALPIYIKHHPDRANDWPGLYGYDKELDRKLPILQAIRRAKVVVTVNSNSGVDAILAGKPVVNIDKGSMVWQLAAQNDFTQIDNPLLPDRTQWAHNLAYCQWTLNEITKGDAWDHLKQFR